MFSFCSRLSRAISHLPDIKESGVVGQRKNNLRFGHLGKQTSPRSEAVTFERLVISSDGEMIVFEVRDGTGNVGHIGIDWLALSTTVQLIGRGAEEASKARRLLGKSDNFDSKKQVSAQLVPTFQVSDLSGQNLKILSLQSPVGFRCDFAIPTNKADQLGRPLHRATAEELLADTSSSRLQRHWIQKYQT
jgi:hypothetical protein